MPKEHYVVSLNRPSGANMSDVEDFIEDRLKLNFATFPGRNTIMDGLKADSVTVKRLTPARAAKISQP